MNLPHREYWARPENADRARRLVAADLEGTAVATVALLGVIGAGAVHVARVGHGGLPWWALAAFVAYLLGTTGYLVHAYRSRYRPADQQADALG